MKRAVSALPADLAALLLESGAVLELGRDGRFAVFGPADGRMERLGHVPAEIVGGLEKAGFVSGDARGRRSLTARGRDALSRRMGIDAVQTRHRSLRMEIVERGEGQGEPVLVDTAESPLAWLARRGSGKGRAFLEPEAVEAGERLRRDFTYAAMQPRMTADWSGTPSGGRGLGGAAELAESVVEARRRVHNALAAVGPELSGVLLDVCCFLKGVEEAERSQGWPARSAKVVLRLALQRLARHYGILPAVAPVAGRETRTRHWGSEDYRPGLGD